MKSKRILITLTEAKIEMLEQLMTEDHEYDESVANYIARLISRESKRREEEKAKRTVGRPRKDNSDDDEYSDDDLIRNIPHPDDTMNAGRMINRAELDGWNELQRMKGL